MAEKIKTQEEPSIEEILGSIRRIIAEDEDDDVPAQKAESSKEEDMQLAMEDDLPEEEPLELTNKIEPDGTIEQVQPALEDSPVEDESIAPELEAAPEPAPQQSANLVEETEPMTDKSTETQGTEPQGMKPMNESPSNPAPNTAQEALLSETTAEATTAVMAKLARQSALNDEGHNGATIETIVREMLRPMLKEWLDQNLPDIVQSMVERELEKLTKRL